MQPDCRKDGLCSATVGCILGVGDCSSGLEVELAKIQKYENFEQMLIPAVYKKPEKYRKAR